MWSVVNLLPSVLRCCPDSCYNTAMQKRLFGIRGAVCAENTEAGITGAVEKLFTRLFAENHLIPEDIVSVQFTVTADLTEINPAFALRHSSCGALVANTALFTAAEAPVKGALPQVIRLLVSAYKEEGSIVRHIYIDGAEKLRPDLQQSK